MVWLILGVLLWAAVHLMPSVFPQVKKQLIERLGENPYKGIFSVLILLSIALIVIGWRSTDPEFLYYLGDWTRIVTAILVLIAFILMGAANYPSRIKRFIRHPQLTGLIIWAGGHLLSNGDSRSLILFGGLGLWAAIEIPLLNARGGEWDKPAAPSIAVEARGLVISFVVYAVLVFLHPYFTGVPVAVH